MDISKALQPAFSAFATLSAIPVNGTSLIGSTGALGAGGVTYMVASGNPCSLDGTTLIGLGEGLCQIIAISAGDINYLPATDTSVTVSVSLNSQGSLILSSSPTTISVGGTSILGVTGGSSGGDVSYEVVSGSCSVTGNTLTGIDVGDCSVVAVMAGNHQYRPVSSNPVFLTVLPVTNTGDTPGGLATANISGGDCVGYAPGSVQFSVPNDPPPGEKFPFGVFGFTAVACEIGGSVSITLNYPQLIPQSARYLKKINGAWIDWTDRVVINGNTVVLTIIDGGEGDTNPVPGKISDSGGPVIAMSPIQPPPNSIPVLGGVAPLFMIIFMFGVLVYRLPVRHGNVS